MLKDYLQSNGISIYALAKKSGAAYSTLNDLVNGKVEIDNCRVSLVRRLAEALDVSMDELYDLCCSSERTVGNSYDAETSLVVRAKYYYARFVYNDEPVDIKLCRVTEDNTFYIEDIARWRVEDYIRTQRMQEFR